MQLRNSCRKWSRASSDGDSLHTEIALPAPALTSNHQRMLSFYQRQLQHFVAFGAVFLTQQEFKTKKFALIPRFLNF